ncbi:hypothetical protein BDZ89DRAFT_434842 [Hymenopellis radicata]|nr:hypothetical protein BDZ89DRAFT_434842 [Hymenopellis radicata]
MTVMERTMAHWLYWYSAQLCSAEVLVRFRIVSFCCVCVAAHISLGQALLGLRLWLVVRLCLL